MPEVAEAPALPAARGIEAARTPLRIAVLSYCLPRTGFRRGGIERVAHDLADGLGRRGHIVTVYSHDPRPNGAAYVVQPLPWAAFVNTWAGRRLTMGYLGNVVAVIPSFRQADVVVAHGDSLLLPLRGRPVLRVMHGSALDEARTATSVGRRILQTGVYGLELLSSATNRWTIAVSETTRRRNPLVRRVIHNGVDRTRFYPAPHAKAPAPTILFVGALGGRKRGRWLLNQFETRIRPAVPAAELHVVCDSDHAAAGVTCHTGLDDCELAGWYRRAWVYASSSTYEGFGLPYVEAMASGTAVVATLNEGSQEVLGSGAGQLVEDDRFADAVIELLRDDARRRTLERAGLERAAQFDLGRTLDAYEALLFEMVRPGD